MPTHPEYADFAAAVRAQPETLVRALDAIRASLDAVRLDPWLPGETVAVLSMGASSNSAGALVTALQSVGVRAVGLTASDLLETPESFEPGDHYVVVSESGRSPEPIAVSRRLAPGRRIGITNYPQEAIAEAVDVTIGLGEIHDSAVYTAGYTATLMAYSALLRAVGHETLAVDEGAVPALVTRALEAFLPGAEDMGRHLEGVRSIDLIGRGYGFTSATQGALMIREAVGIPTAAFETYQYLHGPMEAAGSGTGLIAFGEGRELGLIASQVDAGVKVVLVTAADDTALAELAHENLHVVRLPEGTARFARSIAEVVATQTLVEGLATVRGITIEDFLYTQADTKLPKGGRTA